MSEIKAGSKATEKVIIMNVTNIAPKDGEQKVVLHTTKCKTLKDKDGKPVERFTFTLKQWNNFVIASNLPEVLFRKQIIGGTYSIESQYVKEGDAFLRGEGTYTKAHYAKVTEAIERSSFAVAEDARVASEMYYAAIFNTPKTQSAAPVASVVSSHEDENNGEDIKA